MQQIAGAAILALLATFISCDTIVTPSQTVSVGDQQGAGRTTPNSTLLPGGGVLDSVTIELVDVGGCASGAFTIGLNCVARITATPRSRGVAVPPSLHGPICTWLLDGAPINGSASTNVVYATNTQNAFNLVLFGQARGTFTLEAEVLSVKSGSRTFLVQ